MLDLCTVDFPFCLPSSLSSHVCALGTALLSPLSVFILDPLVATLKQQDSPFSAFVLTREWFEVTVFDRIFPFLWCVAPVKFCLQSPGMFFSNPALLHAC